MIIVVPYSIPENEHTSMNIWSPTLNVKHELIKCKGDVCAKKSVMNAKRMMLKNCINVHIMRRQGAAGIIQVKRCCVIAALNAPINVT